MLARPRHGVDVDWNPAIAVAGLLVGVVVGLTGMGGGALMTPILVFFFGVSPLAAVSSDVVASFFMKPIGGFVHLRRGTVHLRLVGWLCLGWPDGHTETFVGRVDGEAVWPPRGDKGFGYDPMFRPAGRQETFGEMNEDAKHAISHRARAFAQVVAACLPRPHST